MVICGQWRTWCDWYGNGSSLRLWAAISWNIDDGEVMLTHRKQNWSRKMSKMVKWGGNTHKLAGGRGRLPKVEIFQRLNGKLDRKSCEDTEMYPSTFHWSAASLERKKRTFKLLTHGAKLQKLTLTQREERKKAEVASAKRSSEEHILAPKVGKKRKDHEDKSFNLWMWGWTILT